MALELMYITNSPAVALIAEKNGVDRIWIDLEILGKEERQKNMNSVKSHHTLQDVEEISNMLTKSECMVRINPWNENSVDEIEKVITAGADRIMLPMWKTVEEANVFLKTVNRRIKTTLLLETKEAAESLDDVLRLPLVDEIHIGLNDLHLSYGLTFMFELLANGTVEQLCAKMKNAGIRYGFGGVARIGEGMLPAERVIMEHYRLGSTRAILSRSFCNTEEITDISEIEKVFAENVRILREYEKTMPSKNTSEYMDNRSKVVEAVTGIVKKIKERKNA
ncbi:MAG TPA: aldolase [Erysipelotrichaceae bacterium]|nr:aldolase [Erysipelotrichaceae bacterium]